MGDVLSAGLDAKLPVSGRVARGAWPALPAGGGPRGSAAFWAGSLQLGVTVAPNSGAHSSLTSML